MYREDKTTGYLFRGGVDASFSHITGTDPKQLAKAVRSPLARH